MTETLPQRAHSYLNYIANTTAKLHTSTIANANSTGRSTFLHHASLAAGKVTFALRLDWTGTVTDRSKTPRTVQSSCSGWRRSEPGGLARTAARRRRRRRLCRPISIRRALHGAAVAAASNPLWSLVVRVMRSAQCTNGAGPQPPAAGKPEAS